jgi:hypothetical protein
MEIILHIGSQRTGTTFLQHKVFPYIKEINYVDYYWDNDILVRNSEIKKILTNIENVDKEIIKNKIISRLIKDKINLISEENIYCQMFSKEDKRIEKLNVIKNIFPNSKIIFGIRNEDELLVSWFIKYVMNGGVERFDNFQKRILNIEKLNFGLYIKKLYRLFGKKNVFIYKFEDLKKDVNNLVKDICNFIGVEKPIINPSEKRNVSFTINQLKLSLFFNRFFKTSLNQKGLIPLDLYYIPHLFLFNLRYFQELPRKKIDIEALKDITI